MIEIQISLSRNLSTRGSIAEGCSNMLKNIIEERLFFSLKTCVGVGAGAFRARKLAGICLRYPGRLADYVFTYCTVRHCVHMVELFQSGKESVSARGALHEIPNCVVGIARGGHSSPLLSPSSSLPLYIPRRLSSHRRSYVRSGFPPLLPRERSLRSYAKTSR